MIEEEENYKKVNRPTTNLIPKNMLFGKGRSQLGQKEMEELVDAWWNKETIISKILMYIYAEKKVSTYKLTEFIRTTGSRDPVSYLSQITNSNKDESKLFMKRGTFYSLRPEVETYINES